MSNLYITDVNFIEMPEEKIIEPRARYMHYYRDLYRMYGNTVTEKTFYEGGQYSFSELGDQLFNFCQKNNWLNNLDILIPTYWSHEFDPDHSHCGPYLYDKYNLNCDLFDISDQGILAPYSAIKILQKYFLIGKCKKGILMGLEQTTIPRNITDQYLAPMMNGVGALLIQSIDGDSQKKPLFKILDASLLDSSKSQFYDSDILSRYSLNEEQTMLVRSAGSSLLSIFSYLSDLKTNQYSHLILVDQDPVSSDIAWVLLEII